VVGKPKSTTWPAADRIWGCCSKFTPSAPGVGGREGGADGGSERFTTDVAGTDTADGVNMCGAARGDGLVGDEAIGRVRSSWGSIFGALITRSPDPLAIDDAQRLRETS